MNVVTVEYLNQVLAEHFAELHQFLAGQFAQVATKVELNELRTEMDYRFKKVDERFEQVDTKIQNLKNKSNERFDELTIKIDVIHNELLNINAELSSLRKEAVGINHRVTKLENKLNIEQTAI